MTIVRSNALGYRLLFGHWPARRLNGQLWDWTTLALASAMRQAMRPGATVLDVGTGPAGVLAVYAKHRLLGGHVVGVDHTPELLATAAATAARCGARVDFAAGSLGSALAGRFDLIVFNAPYIPLDDGRRLGLLPDSFAELRWSGGPTGLETIRSFLEDAPAHLATTGCILLGVNHFYVAPATIARLIAEAGLVQVSTVSHPLTRAAVYVLRPCSEAPEQEHAG